MFSASSTFSLGVKVDSRSATLCVPLSEARLTCVVADLPGACPSGVRAPCGALRVPDEEDPLAAFLEEEAEAALLVVPEAVGVDVREEVRLGASDAGRLGLEVHGH